MNPKIPIRHVVAPSRKRTLQPRPARLPSSNFPAILQTPSGLDSPTGKILGPGKTIYKFGDPQPYTMRPGFWNPPVVVNARLELLFWGEFWRTAPNPSWYDVSVAVADVVSSPYLSELTQYGFQSLAIGSSTIVVQPEASFQTYSADNVRNMIWDLIDDGKFPEPDEEEIVYMVFSPSGTRYEVDIDSAAHSVAIDTDLFDVDKAWVGWVNYRQSLDEMIKDFSHELVEIISDPEPPSGWVAEGAPADQNEIGDICNQRGMAGGHMVAAYYSDRLKACVVPSFPLSRWIKLNEVSDSLVEFPPVLLASDETPSKKSSCFNGTYKWDLYGEKRQIIVNVDTSSYLMPEVTWSINNTPLSGSGTSSVTVRADPMLDPLDTIQPLPERTATVRGSCNATQLTIDIAADQPPALIEVECSVKESDLPPGYETERHDSMSLLIHGQRREMDGRYNGDLLACMVRKSELARLVSRNDYVIDKGDPIPPWVQRTFGFIEREVEADLHEMLRLAHFVERVDASLSRFLRAGAGNLLVSGIAQLRAKNAPGSTANSGQAPANVIQAL
jgi:hypothetical protein